MSLNIYNKVQKFWDCFNTF